MNSNLPCGQWSGENRQLTRRDYIWEDIGLRVNNLNLVVQHLVCARHWMSSRDGVKIDFGLDIQQPDGLLKK